MLSWGGGGGNYVQYLAPPGYALCSLDNNFDDVSKGITVKFLPVDSISTGGEINNDFIQQGRFGNFSAGGMVYYKASPNEFIIGLEARSTNNRFVIISAVYVDNITEYFIKTDEQKKLCCMGMLDAAVCNNLLGGTFDCDSHMEKYCGLHPTDAYCGCFAPPDSTIDEELRQLLKKPQCYNKDCIIKGYKTRNQREDTTCQSIKVCKSVMDIAGTKNKLSDIVQTIDCSDNKGNAQTQPQPPTTTNTQLPTMTNTQPPTTINTQTSTDIIKNTVNDTKDFNIEDYYMYIFILFVVLVFLGLLYKYANSGDSINNNLSNNNNNEKYLQNNNNEKNKNK